MSEIRCTLHSTFAARYSEHNPVWSMQNLDLARSSVFSVLYIQYYAFKPTYLRICCWCADNSIRVILHICCRIQGALTGLRCVNSGPSTCSVIAVLRIRFQIFESTFLLFYSTHAENSMHLILHICCQIQWTRSGLSCVNSGPCTCSVIAVLHIRSQIFESTFLLFHSTHAENSMHLILHSCCQIQPTSAALSYVISGLR